ncbi:Alpha-1,3-mannosyltransferase-like protein [Boothiomyces sp. JEL0838]|nr:Alpha-1,3-mannosyltransferase-like protein [Boothiomyces sp. JEL0838]KAJ3314226.1 Alpha-1,3-mannosyltransferase-like protein [Boothiomyces sp. JEL0838]
MRKEHLNLAFVHPDLGIGGAERLIVDAAVGLQNKGHSVSVFTSHHDPSHCFEETRDGTLSVIVHGNTIPRHYNGKGHIIFAILKSWWLALVILFNSRVLNQKYDLLIVDQLSASIPILRMAGCNILFYCHFPDKLLTKRESFVKKLYRIPVDFFEEITTKMADVVVVNSKFTASVFNSSFKLIGETPQVLYPGIALESYDKSVNMQDPAVKSLSTPKKMLLSINRFERKKNIELAIKAFAELQKLVPFDFNDLQLVIAGGYDPRVLENVEYLKELSTLATEYKFKYHVWNIDSPTPKNTQTLFLPSFSDAQRTFLLSNAQCLLYTPSNEHFGIVPVEAMYAGLPVIAVNNGGPTETILDTETGFLCESDPSAFADAISKLIKSPNEKKVLGAHGRKHVKETFSLDSFTNSLEEIVYAIDKWFEDLSYYEKTLEDMSNTKLDDSFKDELQAIENWFRVLTDPERTVCIYTLLKGTTPLQIRFFITVLQQMAAKDASLDPLSVSIISRPTSIMSDDSTGGRLYARPNSNGRLSSEVRTHSLLRSSTCSTNEEEDILSDLPSKKESPKEEDWSIKFTQRTSSLNSSPVPNVTPQVHSPVVEKANPNSHIAIAPRQVGGSLPRPRPRQEEEDEHATLPRDKSKPAEPLNLALIQDIPAWFRSLRLHKYTTIFENDDWRDIIKLTDEELERRGVAALGARRKMLKTFETVKEELDLQKIPY